MIPRWFLAAVDDLLFSSKIRATAKQAGVDLTFARSPQEVLDQATAQKPSLVIFDLNSGKTDPVATIAALKADPALSASRVLAFASHVHTELIASARERGRRPGAAAVCVRGEPRGNSPVFRRERPLITRADVEAAAARLSPYVLHTPLRRSEWLSSIAGAPVSLKLETLQETFSYKFRGALNAVLRLCEEPAPPAGLVTASAGNHGRGLAAAAAKAGLPLTVYAPASAPRVKLDAMRRSVHASSSARTTTRLSARRSGTRRQASSTSRLTRIHTSSPAPARWRSKSWRRTRRSRSSSVRLAAVGWRAASPSPPAIAQPHGASKQRRPARSRGAWPPDVSWQSTSSRHWLMDLWGISTRTRSRSTWCGTTSPALRRSPKTMSAAPSASWLRKSD